MTNFEIYLREIGADTLVDKSDDQLRLMLDKLYDYCDARHGKVLGAYMTESFQANDSIKRGKEGLDAHHKMEYDPANPDICSLSNPENAKLFPYEYQKAENLVYCDWIEHQAIHAIIDTLRTRQHGSYRPGCIDRRAPMFNRFFDEPEAYIEYLNERCNSQYFQISLRNIAEELDTYEMIMDAWAEANGDIDWRMLGYGQEAMENIFGEEDDFV